MPDEESWGTGEHKGGLGGEEQSEVDVGEAYTHPSAKALEWTPARQAQNR